MPYCPKCGLEVDNGITECPLCNFTIPDVPYENDLKKEEIELKNYYEELKILKKERKKKTRRVIFIIFILFAVGAGINNALQDYLLNNKLTFSPYVLSSLGLFVICLIVIFGFIKKIQYIFPLLFVSTSAFLFSLDVFSNGVEWFWSVALPLTAMGYGSVLLCLIIFMMRKPGKLIVGSIVLGFVSIMIVLVEVILDLYSGNFSLSWSLQVMIFTASLTLLLMLGKALVNGKWFKKLKRYLHF